MKFHLPFLAVVFFFLPLHLSYAQTQLQMNMETGEALKKTDAKLNQIYKEIMASKGVDADVKSNLRIAQRAWLPFVKAQLDTIFPLKEGENPRALYGSIYPSEFAMAKTELVLQRIKQLEKLMPVADNTQGEGNKAFKEALQQARKNMQSAYNRVLKKNDEDPGFPSVMKEAQSTWAKYAEAQLFSQFPLREEEEKVPDAVYGPTYYADHAQAEIKLIQQRIEVLNGM